MRNLLSVMVAATCTVLAMARTVNVEDVRAPGRTMLDRKSVV